MLITKIPTLHYTFKALGRGSIHNLRGPRNNTKALFAQTNIEFVRDLIAAKIITKRQGGDMLRAYSYIVADPDLMLNPSTVSVSRHKLQNVWFVKSVRAHPQAYLDRGCSHFTLEKVLKAWKDYPANIRSNKNLRLSVKTRCAIKKKQHEVLKKLNKLYARP